MAEQNLTVMRWTQRQEQIHKPSMDSFSVPGALVSAGITPLLFLKNQQDTTTESGNSHGPVKRSTRSTRKVNFV